MSAFAYPCHHCSANPKLPFLKRNKKSFLNEHGEKKLPPRNSSNIRFWPLSASTWGFFTAFNHWNFLPAMFLSGKYLFGNAAFQDNAMIIHMLSLLLLFKKCPHFTTLCTHLANHWHEHSTVLGLGRGRARLGSPTELAHLAVPEKVPPLGPDMGLVSTVRKISIKPLFWMVLRNFVYGGWKCLYIYFKSFYLKLKLFGEETVWYLWRVLEGR